MCPFKATALLTPLLHPSRMPHPPCVTHRTPTGSARPASRRSSSRLSPEPAPWSTSRQEAAAARRRRWRPCSSVAGAARCVLQAATLLPRGSSSCGSRGPCGAAATGGRGVASSSGQARRRPHCWVGDVQDASVAVCRCAGASQLVWHGAVGFRGLSISPGFVSGTAVPGSAVHRLP